MTPAAPRNLVDLYMHHVGLSEVPRRMHFWCCLSLIAATVADRVWYAKFKDSQLSPNLFVMLIAPSGCGKGQAIDVAEKFAKQLETINYYRGKITGPGLVDEMAKRLRRSDAQSRSKIYLVMPELSLNVGTGQPADMLIKTLTEMYTGGDYTLKDRTRMHGMKEVESPHVNWLAGSTKEWLLGSVTKDAILGGFFARTCAIQDDYNTELRILDPQYPEDYAGARDEILSRLEELALLTGRMRMTVGAKEVEREWYENRPSPTHEGVYPFFRREHDLMLKLAMLFSLADGIDLIIRRKHVAAAQKVVGDLRRQLPSIIEFAYVTPDTAPKKIVSDVVERAGRVSRAVLLRRVASRGVNAQRLSEALRALAEEGKVRTLASTETGARWYEWTRKKLKKAKPEETAVKE